MIDVFESQLLCSCLHLHFI